MIAGETICSGAASVCFDCKCQPLHDLRLSSAAGPAAIQAWCECGPYSRESIYIESPVRAKMILEACRRAVKAAGGLQVVEVLYVSRILEGFRVGR